MVEATAGVLVCRKRWVKHAVGGMMVVVSAGVSRHFAKCLESVGRDGWWRERTRRGGIYADFCKMSAGGDEVFWHWVSGHAVPV